MESDLSSFGKNLNVAIFGASGGIGHAATRLLDQCANVENVHAFSRSATGPTLKKGHIKTFDLLDETSIQNAAATIEAPIDIVFVATGLLHYEEENEASISPEKSWRAFQADQSLRIFSINTIGPMLIAKHFLPKLACDKKTAFAAISARVGSISDNHIGGWYSYRASKAALNQMIRCAAIELSRKLPEAICVGLHPGTVNTQLSKPFQSAVKADKLFLPEYSAYQMLSVLNSLSADQTGQLLAYDGIEIQP